MSETRKHGFPMADPTLLHVNSSVASLYEASLRLNEAKLTENGALAAYTGKYTGRSPADKFIVDDELTHDQVDWGAVNQPFDSARFARLMARVEEYFQGREQYIFDGFVGADPAYQMPIRVVAEQAWHALFAHQLFIRSSDSQRSRDESVFTVVDAGRFLADPARDGTRSETFIILDLTRRLALIGGTQYAGEIKKSVFSALNFLLPQRDVLPMHCSANIGKTREVALFFGLSGTGKTTLSADPERALIGDDEHGWSDSGIFNFEGGCYAKCIHLSPKREPEIWNAIRFGTVLENVALHDETRQADYDDARHTENTRAAYPLAYIPNAVLPSIGGQPRTVIFLTADAFGVLPPIARLTKEQAMYHFLSGYTSKLAGTERGISAPQATFSTCFGAPFMSLPPLRYAKMLGERLNATGARCWLINTGWSGGAYGVGERIALDLTRQMVRAALSGELDSVAVTTDPIFHLNVPNFCPGIPADVLDFRAAWSDPLAYDAAARALAQRFIDNFARFSDADETIKEAGPKVLLR